MAAVDVDAGAKLPAAVADKNRHLAAAGIGDDQISPAIAVQIAGGDANRLQIGLQLTDERCDCRTAEIE